MITRRVSPSREIFRNREWATRTRNIETNCRSIDPNRQHLFDPSFSRITFLQRVETDPFEWDMPSKHSWQQISHRQVFDLPIFNGGPDYRAL
jgi:hypothetical protein